MKPSERIEQIVEDRDRAAGCGSGGSVSRLQQATVRDVIAYLDEQADNDVIRAFQRALASAVGPQAAGLGLWASEVAKDRDARSPDRAGELGAATDGLKLVTGAVFKNAFGDELAIDSEGRILFGRAGELWAPLAGSVALADARKVIQATNRPVVAKDRDSQKAAQAEEPDAATDGLSVDVLVAEGDVLSLRGKQLFTDEAYFVTEHQPSDLAKSFGAGVQVAEHPLAETISEAHEPGRYTMRVVLTPVVPSE